MFQGDVQVWGKMRRQNIAGNLGWRKYLAEQSVALREKKNFVVKAHQRG